MAANSVAIAPGLSRPLLGALEKSFYFGIALSALADEKMSAGGRSRPACDNWIREASSHRFSAISSKMLSSARFEIPSKPPRNLMHFVHK